MPQTVLQGDVQVFLERLNRRNDGYLYRLPTEAEWEYAARAGDSRMFPAPHVEFAWSRTNSPDGPQAVGQKKPNAWGLFDALGNAWELVQDWYGETYYAESPEVDPGGPKSGTMRVYRGGSWLDWGGMYSSRSGIPPAQRGRGMGFRCVRERLSP